MNNIPIHVMLPQSFIDERHVNPLDVVDAMSVVFNDKPVSFQVDVVSDDYFGKFYV